MIGLRDRHVMRLAAALAGLALYVQLAFASWGMLGLASPGDPADGFGGHALCLAGATGATNPVAPTHGAPTAPAHDHAAFCCLWHSLPGVALQAALVPLPVAYARLAQSLLRDVAFTPVAQHSPANARAPPALA
jgi:hypothetical protein